MTKERIQYYSDFIPPVILIICACQLIWTVNSTDIVLVNEHYVGLGLLAVSILIFFIRHKFGVLAIGIILFLGLFTLISFSAEIEYYRIGGSINGHSSGDIRIQSIFCIWIVIYIVFSKRHFHGLFTKKYWQSIFKSLPKN